MPRILCGCEKDTHYTNKVKIESNLSFSDKLLWEIDGRAIKRFLCLISDVYNSRMMQVDYLRIYEWTLQNNLYYEKMIINLNINETWQ